MVGDLGLTDSIFGNASGIFFIGYFALQVPGAVLVERWSARRLLAITLVAWGALTTLTAFVRTPSQLYGARFLLGAAEAGFFPGVIVYLSHWFIYQDRAKAVARFMSAIPIAYIFGGPLAGAILGIKWLGTPGWRWLFLLEGIPAVLLGIATWFVLPDWPDQAHWLSPNEHEWITSRLAEERRAKAHAEQMSILRALRHSPVIILTSGLFFCYSGGYIFWFWMPRLLKRMTGWTDFHVSLMGSIPFIAGLIGMLLVGWNSDRTRERRWHFAIPQLTAALGLTSWFLLPHSNIVLMIVFTLIGFGSVAYLPAFWALPSAFLTSAAAAAAVGFINCTASLGGYVGTWLFGDLSQRTASFNTGFGVMIACWVIASGLVLICPRERA
jgi:ACS family tartrate transporter-like MFS transporter